MTVSVLTISKHSYIVSYNLQNNKELYILCARSEFISSILFICRFIGKTYSDMSPPALSLLKN